MFGSPVFANWVQYLTMVADRACSSLVSVEPAGAGMFQRNWSSLACAAWYSNMGSAGGTGKSSSGAAWSLNSYAYVGLFAESCIAATRPGQEKTKSVPAAVRARFGFIM